MAKLLFWLPVVTVIALVGQPEMVGGVVSGGETALKRIHHKIHQNSTQKIHLIKHVINFLNILKSDQSKNKMELLVNCRNKKTMGKQVSAAYLPLLCTNESWVRSLVPALMCTWFPVQTCFSRFFSVHSGFPPASKTRPKKI